MGLVAHVPETLERMSSAFSNDRQKVYRLEIIL